MEVKFYNTDIVFTESMKRNTKEKLSILDKYDNVIKPSTTAKLTLLKNDKVKKIKVVIPIKNRSIIAETSDIDYYTALDRAVDILERQIRKTKERKIEKFRKTRYWPEELEIHTLENIKANLSKKAVKELESIQNQRNAIDGEVVKEKFIFLEKISQEEAINRMLELGHDFYVYNDDTLNKTCVLYIRYDGDYGLLICN